MDSRVRFTVRRVVVALTNRFGIFAPALPEATGVVIADLYSTRSARTRARDLLSWNANSASSTVGLAVCCRRSCTGSRRGEEYGESHPEAKHCGEFTGHARVVPKSPSWQSCRVALLYVGPKCQRIDCWSVIE